MGAFAGVSSGIFWWDSPRDLLQFCPVMEE